MNIHEATKRALELETSTHERHFLRNRNRTWTLYVAAGGVYRRVPSDAERARGGYLARLPGEQVDLDAKDCLSPEWYVVDHDDKEVVGP